MNHLVSEKSPYLLQHIHNPVDWYPWGDAAFDLAHREDKLIFLSIGYSTCHWCHVMAHESFEDDAVAVLLNQDYVAIKVDREERPDVDHVYMEACQKMTGSGGWPLTIIMTPDSQPFYAATYIPKEGRHGRPGLMNLLPWIADKWLRDADYLRGAAREIVAGLQPGSSSGDVGMLDNAVFKTAVLMLQKGFDSQYGGFSKAPKFPRPHDLTFLLRRYRQTQDEELLKMVEKTLQTMRQGGLYDQLGFGFHRYSTDERWLVPHFEKMLYDQAGLTLAYLEAFQVTGEKLYAGTAREILTYLLRDMTSPEGGFYSAEDADSEGVEGQFYLWTVAEIDAVLGSNEARLFNEVYGATVAGNYHDEVTGGVTGSNILHLYASLDKVCKDTNQSCDGRHKTLERNRLKLLAEREKRVRPHLDDKIVASWNGLMISALAKAGQLFAETCYLDAAKRSVDFVLHRMRTDTGRLLRRYRDGEAAIPAFAEDYAFFARGLLDLYAATGDPEHLNMAVSLAEELRRYFHDDESGFLYDTADDAEALLLRPHTTYDGAMPAAGSVALELYARLFLLTGQAQWRDWAEQLLRALSPEIAQYPAGYTQLLQSASLLLEPTCEVVIVGKPGAESTEAMLAAVRQTYAPESVMLFKSTHNPAATTALSPFSAQLEAVSDQATAYLCESFTCRQPTTDPAELAALLSVPPT